MAGIFRFGKFEFTEQHASAGLHMVAMIDRDIFMCALSPLLDEWQVAALPSLAYPLKVYRT
jgi:hypothetical protein